MDADLLSVVLSVTPLAGSAPASENKTTYGRAVHALLLDAIRQVDAALAERLHDGSGLRPFTVSDLIGYSPRRGLDPARSYSLRFTALTREAAQAIRQAVSDGPLCPGQLIRLGDVEFKTATTAPNRSPVLEEHQNRQGANGSHSPALREAPPATETLAGGGGSWAAATTYESLSAPWLLGRASPQPRLTFQLASPTTFKSQDKHVPVPLPAWVFGSLLEKWNAFAPVALPPETRRFAEECLALSGFEIRSRPMYVKDSGVRVGAVGIARYTALNRDRYWLSVMNLLADFALFAGVGAGTTMGLGQCRRVQTR